MVNYFYFTDSDIRSWLLAFESHTPIAYSLSSAIGAIPQQWSSCADIPDFGVPQFDESGRPMLSRYFVHPQEYQFNARAVLLAGENQSMYVIDTEMNPGCIILVLGGIGNGKYIMPSELTAYMNDTESKKLRKKMVVAFDSVGFTYKDVAVGADAAKLYQNGYRFCRSLEASTKHDFKLGRKHPVQK